MQLTVLGCSPSWPNPGGACSGYLVSSRRSNLLLECGPGTLGRLRQHLEVGKLDAIVVSHLHADHFLDLVPLRYGLRYGGLGGERQLKLLVPPGGATWLAGLGRALDGNERFFEDTFALAEYDPARELRVGSLAISFRRVQHYIPSYAVRLRDGATLVFSGDAAPCDALVEHAAGATVLLCEAAVRRPEPDRATPAERGHMTPAEAGQMARRAGVERLILTHYPADSADPDYAVREASATFDGTIERAVDGAVFSL